MGALDAAISSSTDDDQERPVLAVAIKPPGVLALLEVLDRDGQVRQALAVHAWPLSVGRGLVNDVVLADPYVSAQHLRIEAGADGLELIVGETRNGVVWAAERLRSGDHRTLALTGEAIEMTLGRSRIRLRLPGHALPPELALAASATRVRRVLPLALSALVLLAGLMFNTYLANDADGFGRAAGNMLLSALLGAAVWCGAWALLSKTFTRQSHFGWHLRVFLLASIGLLLVEALPSLLAFAFSWPGISDFSFVAVYAVGATALYFHLLAVEPARHRLLRWVAVTGAAVGVALTLWFNLQRSDLLGEELYMSHLFPPALRLARPVAADAFIRGLAPLQRVLDKKAVEAAHGDDAGTRGDDE